MIVIYKFLPKYFREIHELSGASYDTIIDMYQHPLNAGEKYLVFNRPGHGSDVLQADYSDLVEMQLTHHTIYA